MKTNISRVARVSLISFLLLTGSYHSTFAQRSVQTSAEFSPATLVVTKTADTGDGLCDSDCSLREAVNAAASGDTIIFDPTLSGQTIFISETINDSIRIDGKDLVIDGSSLGTNIRISGENLLIRPLQIEYLSTVILKNIDFINGSASGGGAISNSGDLTISNSTFSNNFASETGGAIDNAGELTITGSTFRDNVSENHGGAIYTWGSSLLTIKNSTFYNNSATGNGGGIYDGSVYITILNSTFSGNSAALGGGIYYSAGGLDLKNTILANSISGGDCYMNTGIITSSTNNLIETNGSSGHACGTPVSTADPLLEGLADNGGPTQTMALLSGSPAIDTGDDVTCETTDQRGVARPLGDHCDIGAFEFAVIYVTPGGLASGNCVSWAGACELQYALGLASVGNELWVQAGTYTPSSSLDRAASFQLVDGVAIYGGFAGTETSREERDPIANLTILSGDIDGDDIQKPIITDLTTETNNTNNSFHVVTGAVANTTTVLDGFTITAGYANGSSYPDNQGGGMFSQGNPGLANLTFIGNYANVGGGLDNHNGSPSIMNVSFIGNSAKDGGGMYSQGNTGLTNVSFIGNTAIHGGGMVCAVGSHSLMNVSFIDNSASDGGGIYSHGTCNSILANATFSDNSANEGGGISFYGNSGAYLTNVTFSGNSATEASVIFRLLANNWITIYNSILWDNGPPESQINIWAFMEISNSVVQGYAGGTNIIIADPMLGTLTDFGGSGKQVIPILSGSSAIDMGDDVNCPAADQRGVARPQGDHCDIGAFEYEPGSVTYTVTYDGNGSDSGTAPVDLSSPYVVGATVTVLDNTDLARTNYVFTGWNTQADGLGTDYAPGDTFSMPAANITLYAQWTPTIYSLRFKSQPKYDGWVLESGEFTNQGGIIDNRSNTMPIGDDADDRQYRVILSFRTAAIPENAVITKVILKVKRMRVYGFDPMITHNGLVVDIRKGKFYTLPALQSNDFQAGAGKYRVGKFSNKLFSGWYRSILRKGAYDHINKNGRTQFRLRFLLDDNDDNNIDVLTLYSGNAILANRPRLIVKYYVQ